MSRAMRDSGIPWIGDIPQKWSTDTIGSLYSLRNEKVSDRDYPPLSVTKNGVVPQLENAAKTDDGDNRKLVRKGDFAINSRSDRRGSCGISDYDGSVSLINTIITPRKEMNPQFYNWFFHSEAFADEFYKWGHGIVDDLWTTRWQEMKRISVVLPSLPEQQKIATFLNEKCGEIDETIALQGEFIEELKTYRQSVITEAVTNGLDSKALLKSSGIDLIGDIPQDWEVARLKQFTSKIGSGSTPSGGASVYVKEGIRFIRSQNVYNSGFVLDDIVYITEKTNEQMKGTQVMVNDILFNITGGSIGRCYIVDETMGKANVNQHVSIVRPSKINGKFLMYFLQSDVSQKQVAILQTGGNREGLTSSAFGEFKITIPSEIEQCEIVNYLDEKCAEIDSLIAIKQQKIEELKEYKKSIIYEYVTGKKEVDG